MALKVLLVEDSPGDVRLIQEAFRASSIEVAMHVAVDGIEALAFLGKGKTDPERSPDLILLDLNLPKMDGKEVLAHIKADERLKTIPTVILTTSEAESDIVRSYQLQANAYLSKPVGLAEFEGLISSLSDFWLAKAKLPPQAPG